MRVLPILVAVALSAGCGQSGGPEGTHPDAGTSVSMPSNRIDVTAVARVRSELPAGYEVAGLSGPTAPVNLWGLGTQWEAVPDGCRTLVDWGPTADVSGWSASGPGGIVYAVVAAVPVGQGPPIDDSCGQWSVSGAGTEGAVSYLPAPTIESGSAIGLASSLTTRVEGGTETHSHAETFTAYLGDHVAYVVVVTDPGSAGPPLPAGFASDLLVKTVAAIRG